MFHLLLVFALHFVSAMPLDAEGAAWFQEARFGLFVHWGPVSLKGTEIGWSRGGERRGRTGTGSIPVEVYDSLYKEFNPVEFDAVEWVEIARAAGMKYLVFTTKHHDGFCMFDTALSDYKITNSPFERDVVAELAKACHDKGLKLGFYYSPPDWHHADYRTENHEKYIAYLHGQLRELCTRYGKVDILWFDGLGGKPEDWDSTTLIPMIRELQPGILINNRAGLPCDFDTPEQRIGKFQNDRLWESCITICRQWAWKPDDILKSLDECIHILVRCAGGDGNLLLNVGPMPTGEIEPRQVERLKEIGEWLERYGKSIYGTRGGPFLPGKWGASTYRKNRIYLHLLDWEGDSILFPALEPEDPEFSDSSEITSYALMTGGKCELKMAEEGFEISVPPEDRHGIDTIVELTLKGPAGECLVKRLPSRSLAAWKKAAASNVFRNDNRNHGPDKAIDDDDGTRWATDAGVHEAWLEVDLGKESLFDRAVIKEAYDRVQKFELQVSEGGGWKTIAQGEKIGKALSLAFKPVRARLVRLHILEASEGPTIWEFQLFPPEKTR